TANDAEHLADLRGNEIAMLLPLIILFFIIGLFPNLFLDKINPSVEALLNNQPAIVASVEQ
ncbi:MAG: Fe-S-binding domain-containing protein, partial [Caldilineaceae bacterium]|nr:Fe-S-binding domain-containing protein [Caldilineaceae bacterium]